MNRSTIDKLYKASAVLLGAGLLYVVPANAHDERAHCASIAASISDAGFADDVAVTCADGVAVVASDTYPDHTLMTGIVGTNEQLPVPANYAAPVPLQPSLGSSPLTRDAALGVAVNGVPIYDYTGGGEMSQADLAHHQAQHDTLLTKQLDVCGGHAGRGDDYHYHVKPTCMIEQMENAGDDAVIGWAFDGFPIYGDNNPDGSSIPEGALDVCNGQPDDIFGYRYHTSQEAPYIVQCLMGELPNAGALPRVRPMTKSAGRPPRGGVQGLVYTEDAAGTRSMEYTYQGADYFMRYTPTVRPGCYSYETRTVTNKGVTKTGEYCR